ncbi:TRAP transporter TatT component family protein [Calditrichota bacterium]
MWKYIILLLVILSSSCSLEKFIIRQTGTLLDYGVLALYEETDLVLAEQALASDIKLLEGMIKGDPDNRDLLILTAQAISGYTVGFVEDQSAERAKPLYLRAKNYASKILQNEDINIDAENIIIDDYKKMISGIDEDNIDALFWAAFSWAGWINLSLDNPQAFIDLPKVEVLMQRVLEIDSHYYHGAALLFFGSVWGMKPRMIGGNPEKAKELFEKNLEITKGNFLLTYVYYAKYYAAKTLDEELFVNLLQKIKNTPDDVLPGSQLLNAIAKKKADYLLSKKEDIF